MVVDALREKTGGEDCVDVLKMAHKQITTLMQTNPSIVEKEFRYQMFIFEQILLTHFPQKSIVNNSLFIYTLDHVFLTEFANHLQMLQQMIYGISIIPLLMTLLIWSNTMKTIGSVQMLNTGILLSIR